jgi:NAD(P)H-nitrite reductase large subunit
MLTKAMLSGLDGAQMALHPAGWYDAQKIVQILNRQVTAIQPHEKTVVLDGELKLPYTKLIYALGSDCFIPPIPGHEQQGVVAIRRLSDTAKVQAMGTKLKQAVVIGGGVLGLEAAWELRKAKCEVTVLELAPSIMSRQLDDTAAALLLDHCAKSGVRVETGVQIAAIEGSGQVTGVKLGSGEVIPAQLVVVSCGVRAATALAKEAGLDVDRAVVVNEKMETSFPGIYACGDCAQYQGINYALWPEAQEQGKVAGACATGDDAAYDTIAAITSFHGMGTELFSLGDPGRNPKLTYKTVEVKDAPKGLLEKYFFTDDRLCGVILMGDVSKMGDMIAAIEEKRPFGKFFA